MNERIFAGCVFDMQQAETMIGKTVLVSLTCMNDVGDLEAFEQFFGPILRINNEDELVVMCNDTEEEFSLPPDLDHYLPAKAW